MTLTDLTYTILALATLTTLTLRYYLHHRRERHQFRRPTLPPPGPPLP